MILGWYLGAQMAKVDMWQKIPEDAFPRLHKMESSSLQRQSEVLFIYFKIKDIKCNIEF